MSTTEPPAPSPAGGTKSPPRPGQLRKLLIELGPLIIFFVVYKQKDIFWATGAFMVAITVSLIVSWVLERRLPRMLVTSAVLVLIFGGLTIALHDGELIKIKMTVTYLLFAGILLVGLVRNRMALRWLMESSLRLTDTGWRRMTIAWIVFFCLLAILNEVIRGVLSQDAWVNFKVFGVLALTVVFSICLAPLISGHMLEEEPEGKLPPGEDAP
jgi:intracellular septation protein